MASQAPEKRARGNPEDGDASGDNSAKPSDRATSPKAKQPRSAGMVELIALAEAAGGINWGIGRSQRSARNRGVSDPMSPLVYVKTPTPRSKARKTAAEGRKGKRTTTKASQSPRSVAPKRQARAKPAAPVQRAPTRTDSPLSPVVEEQLEPEDVADWVLCTQCGIWRVAPTGTDVASLSDTWQCKDALWHSKTGLTCGVADKASTDAEAAAHAELAVAPSADETAMVSDGMNNSLGQFSEPKALEFAEESQLQAQNAEEWAACTRCGKWRRLPPWVAADSIAKQWVCEQGAAWAPGLHCGVPDDSTREPSDTIQASASSPSSLSTTQSQRKTRTFATSAAEGFSSPQEVLNCDNVIEAATMALRHAARPVDAYTAVLKERTSASLAASSRSTYGPSRLGLLAPSAATSSSSSSVAKTASSRMFNDGSNKTQSSSSSSLGMVGGLPSTSPSSLSERPPAASPFAVLIATNMLQAATGNASVSSVAPTRAAAAAAAAAASNTAPSSSSCSSVSVRAASSSTLDIPALPEWAEPLRLLSGYPGAPQPWREVSGIGSVPALHPLVAVGLGRPPPAGAGRAMIEAFDQDSSAGRAGVGSGVGGARGWAEMVFPNGSKPRYSGAVASGRGATAEQAHMIGVGSSTYDPNAVDLAVWGGLPASLGSGAVRWSRTAMQKKKKQIMTSQRGSDHEDDEDDDVTESILHFGSRKSDAEAFKRAIQLRDADSHAPDSSFRKDGARLLRERANRSNTFREALSRHRRGAGTRGEERERGGGAMCLSARELGAGAADIMTNTKRLASTPSTASAASSCQGGQSVQASAITIEDIVSRIVTEDKVLELVSTTKSKVPVQTGLSIARDLTRQLLAEQQKSAGSASGGEDSSISHKLQQSADVHLAGLTVSRVLAACVVLVNCLLERLRVAGKVRQVEASQPGERVTHNIGAWVRVGRTGGGESGVAPRLTKPWRLHAARTKLQAALAGQQRQKIDMASSQLPLDDRTV